MMLPFFGLCMTIYGCMAYRLYGQGYQVWAVMMVFIMAFLLLFVLWVWECRRVVSYGRYLYLRIFTRIPCLVGWHEMHYRRGYLENGWGTRGNLVLGRCCHCGFEYRDVSVNGGDTAGCAVVYEHGDDDSIRWMGEGKKHSGWYIRSHIKLPYHVIYGWGWPVRLD